MLRRVVGVRGVVLALAFAAAGGTAQDTCNWQDFGPMPTDWMDAGNWTCGGATVWPGDDTAILDAGIVVNVITPIGGLFLNDLDITDQQVTVRAGGGGFTAAIVTGAGVFDASLATTVTVNAMGVGSYLAPPPPMVTTVTTGDFLIGNTMVHNNGIVDLDGAGLFAAPGAGFFMVNVTGNYLLAGDTSVESLVVGPPAGIVDVDVTTLTIRGIIDIFSSTAFLGGDGTIILENGANWVTTGANLTAENGVVIFQGTGPTIPTESWGHLEVQGNRTAGGILRDAGPDHPPGGASEHGRVRPDRDPSGGNRRRCARSTRHPFYSADRRRHHRPEPSAQQ